MIHDINFSKYNIVGEPKEEFIPAELMFGADNMLAIGKACYGQKKFNIKQCEPIYFLCYLNILIEGNWDTLSLSEKLLRCDRGFMWYRDKVSNTAKLFLPYPRWGNYNQRKIARTLKSLSKNKLVVRKRSGEVFPDTSFNPNIYAIRVNGEYIKSLLT